MSGAIALWLAAPVFSVAAVAVVYLHSGKAGASAAQGGPYSLWTLLALANVVLFAFGFMANYGYLRSGVLRRVRGRDWAWMVLIGLLSGGLAPALLFKAVLTGGVIGVVLISRIEPALTLFLAAMVLGVQASGFRVAGGFLSLAGVLLMLLIEGPAGGLGKPGEVFFSQFEVLTAAACVVMAIASVLYKSRLPHVSVSVYVVARAAVCSVMFFVVGTVMFGTDALAALVGDEVWPYAVTYAAVFGAVAPMLWLFGLRNAHPATAMIAASVAPFAAVVAAYSFLGHRPSAAEWIGGAVICLGVLLTAVGAWGERRRGENFGSVGSSDEFDSVLGFKGV